MIELEELVTCRGGKVGLVLGWGLLLGGGRLLRVLLAMIRARILGGLEGTH